MTLTTLDERRLPAVSFAQRASRPFMVNALNQVCLATGINLSDERKAAIVLVLEGAGYTVAQVSLAAKDLCLDTELDAKIRYGHTLAAADFKRAIEGEGAARHAKLLTWHEAIQKHAKMGDDVRFDLVFEPVEVDGRDKPLWRMV